MLGNLMDFAENPLDFLLKCAREHGDVVRIARRNYLLNHPDLIQHVFHDRDGLYEKIDPSDTRSDRSAFPASVMSSSGADWQTKRRALQPAFHKDLVRAGVAQAVSIVRPFIGTWQGEPGLRDIRQEMENLCMAVGSRFLFGSPAEAGEADAIARMVDAIIRLTRSPVRLPSIIPTPGNLRLRRARSELERSIAGIVERYRSSSSRQTCLLGTLLEGGEGEHPAWLRDELATMIMSGLEPMADALSWTLYLLAAHEEPRQRLIGEVDALLDAQGEISVAALPALRFTEAAVKEAMRLYPPAWMTGRTAVRDCRLGGFHIPAGTMLTVSQWVSHRDPRYFADPEDYRPQRWLDAGFLASLPRYAYFPFGGGLRMCIGNYLTMTQMVVIVASILHGVDLRLVAGAEVRPYPALVLRPLGVRMNIAPRRRAASCPASS